MLEVLLNFEEAAGRLSPIVLIGPGLIAVLIGLFVWLGGLGLKKLLAAATGAVSGGTCGFFLIDQNIIAAIGMAAAAAAIAVIFQKLFIVILTALLAAIVGFVVLATLSNGKAKAAISTNQKKTSAQLETLDVSQSVELVKAYTVDITARIKQICREMPIHYWGILLVLVVICVVVGCALYRLTSAFCCATLGTTLVFVGMISLLLYKGSTPIDIINHKPSFYGVILGAMIAFGTIEQLFLCRRPKKQSTKTKPAADKKQSARYNWRTE